MADQTHTTVAPRPSRRGLLSFLTATVAAGGVPVVAVAASAPRPQESPEVATLLDEALGLMDAYQAAHRQRLLAKEAFDRLRPAVPEEIVWRRDQFAGDRDLVRMEMDIDESIAQDDEGRRHIYNSRLVRAEIILKDRSPRTKEGKRLRRIARIAKQFEAEWTTAYAASGWAATAEAIWFAARPPLRMLPSLCAIELSTPRDAAAYAKLVAGFSDMQAREDGIGISVVASLGVHLARAIVRLEVSRG